MRSDLRLDYVSLSSDLGKCDQHIPLKQEEFIKKQNIQSQPRHKRTDAYHQRTQIEECSKIYFLCIALVEGDDPIDQHRHTHNAELVEHLNDGIVGGSSVDLDIRISPSQEKHLQIIKYLLKIAVPQSHSAGGKAIEVMCA